ncbi:MAG: hypothetical protein K9M54_04390 [Kiritimatiellales bacterium]|nr:hypothetical protein [Kiritimatiellales bacterium]
MTSPADQIWAYLHNELAPEQKERFEQALQNDPGLRDALEECQATHTELASLLPLLDTAGESDDQLEERLLAEWETEHPEYAERSVQTPRRNILRFTLPLAAAAAAALILLALPWNPGPVRWQRTAYGTAPQLRGQPAEQPHYTRAELKQTSRELQEAIESRLADAPGRWVLQISLQELAAGSLSVEISGHPRADANRSSHWSQSFQTLELFRANIPLLGKQVADDLVAQDGQ